MIEIHLMRLELLPAVVAGSFAKCPESISCRILSPPDASDLRGAVFAVVASVRCPLVPFWHTAIIEHMLYQAALACGIQPHAPQLSSSCGSVTMRGWERCGCGITSMPMPKTDSSRSARSTSAGGPAATMCASSSRTTRSA